MILGVLISHGRIGCKRSVFGRRKKKISREETEKQAMREFLENGGKITKLPSTGMIINKGEKMQVICFYHKVDLDGKCSAAIVKRKYPDAECIGVDYPDKPDFEKVQTADCVIIVDFCFETLDMLQIAATAKQVIWIDHHKSAIEKMRDNAAACGKSLETWLLGKREIGKAACALTWEYFFPDEPMPFAIELAGYHHIQSKGLNN